MSEILIDYDYDKKIPCYGFGASVNGSGTKHCFPLVNYLTFSIINNYK